MRAGSSEPTCSSCGRTLDAGTRFCPDDGTPVVMLPTGDAGRDGDAPSDLPVGRVLAGRYEILGPLGSGGMSKVYRARHRMLGRDVAIKILKRGLAATSRAADRFRREAKVASRIEHDHIVYLTDFGVSEDGLMFMVMEHVQGPGLHDLVESSAGLPWRRVVELCLQVARALAVAHDLGIVHRDLKPENLIVTQRQGRDHIKVLDFGIAKLIDPSESHQDLTQTGMVFGTPEYMSPEHAQGRKTDGRSDLYALGLIFWECLVGRRAVQGASAPITMALHLTHDPGPASTHASPRPVPAAVDAVVAKLIQKKPAMRFQSAIEVVEVLARILDSEPAQQPQSPSPGAMETAVDNKVRSDVVAIMGKPGSRNPVRQREAAIQQLVDALWQAPGDRPAAVVHAQDALHGAEEKLLSAQTDLAWVIDEVARMRGAPEVGEDHPALHDMAQRTELLRSRIDRLARIREAHLFTLSWLVSAARTGAPHLAEGFAHLDALNAEVALASGLGSLV